MRPCSFCPVPLLYSEPSIQLRSTELAKHVIGEKAGLGGSVTRQFLSVQ